MARPARISKHAGQYAAYYFGCVACALLLSGFFLCAVAALLNAKLSLSLLLPRFALDFGLSFFAAYLGEYAQGADRKSRSGFAAATGLSVLFLGFGIIPGLGDHAWEAFQQTASGDFSPAKSSVLGALLHTDTTLKPGVAYLALVLFFLAAAFVISFVAARSIREKGVSRRSVAQEHLYLSATFLLFVNTLLLQPVWSLDSQSPLNLTLHLPALIGFIFAALYTIFLVALVASQANFYAVTVGRFLSGSGSAWQFFKWFLRGLFVEGRVYLILALQIGALLFLIFNLAELSPTNQVFETTTVIKNRFASSAPSWSEIVSAWRSLALVVLLPFGLMLGVFIFRVAPDATRIARSSFASLLTALVSLFRFIVGGFRRATSNVRELHRRLMSFRFRNWAIRKPPSLPNLNWLLALCTGSAIEIFAAVFRAFARQRWIYSAATGFAAVSLASSTQPIKLAFGHSQIIVAPVPARHSYDPPQRMRIRVSLQQASVVCNPENWDTDLVWSFKEESRVALPVSSCEVAAVPEDTVAVVFVGRSSREGSLDEENNRALRRGWAIATAAAPTLYTIRQDRLYVMNLGRSDGQSGLTSDASKNASERQVQVLLARSGDADLGNQEALELAVTTAVREWKGKASNGICELFKYNQGMAAPTSGAKVRC